MKNGVVFNPADLRESSSLLLTLLVHAHLKGVMLAQPVKASVVQTDV